MNETKIVESIHLYKNSIKKTIYIFAIISILSFIVCKNFYKILSSLGIYLIANGIPMLLGICGIITTVITFVLTIFYFYIYKMQLIVTDKRVYGKTSFGEQVDLPLDSISAIGTSAFKGITVSTSSGRIKFLGISNRDEIHKEISQLLIERQTKKEVKANATQPIAGNNLDDVKKLKELLDSGLISQEEFDAKKKQILGL